MKKVLVVNGPNLNLLGRREPGVYGTGSLKELLSDLRKKARLMGVRLRTYQSNHEGKLIDRLHRLRSGGFAAGRPAGNKYIGVIINPGALTHYSYSLRDALKAVGLPAIEVHLSDIERREEFRKVSVIREVCIGQVKGMGPEGYERALHMLLEHAGTPPGS